MIFPANTWLCHHTSHLLCPIAFILFPDSLLGQYVSFFDLSANAKSEETVIHNNQVFELHTFHPNLHFDSLDSLSFFEALSNQENTESPMIESIALGISFDSNNQLIPLTTRTYENILHSQIKVDYDQTYGKNQIANDLRVGMQSLSLFSFDFPKPQNLEIKTVHYQDFTNGPSSYPQIDFYERKLIVSLNQRMNSIYITYMKINFTESRKLLPYLLAQSSLPQPLHIPSFKKTHSKTFLISHTIMLISRRMFLHGAMRNSILTEKR